MLGMGQEPLDEQAAGATRVLLVEDDEAFAAMTKRVLEQQAAELTVDVVGNAPAALDHLAEVPIDAVVSDYAMPDMDGLELLEAIRADQPDLPFILLTGRGSEDVASQAIASGATDYLQKGTSRDLGEVLGNRITNAVAHTRSHAALEQRERRFRTLIEHSPATIAVLAPDGTYTYVSPSVREMFGALPCPQRMCPV